MNGERTRIGDRRHHVVIQQPTQARGNWGEPMETWTVFARVWAAKLAHSGREFYRAQQRQAEVSEVFNIAPLTGITTLMRIVCDGETYNIVDVDDSDLRWINLSAVAVR